LISGYVIIALACRASRVYLSTFGDMFMINRIDYDNHITKKSTTSYSMTDKNKSIRELVIQMVSVPLKSKRQDNVTNK